MIKGLKPCPRCGSKDIKPRMPIKAYLRYDEILKIFTKGNTSMFENHLLEGPCYFMCFNCAHKGPSIDYSDRTASDVNQNKEIYEEMKELWNNQRKGLVI